jgi:methylenetetrahydrofolate reductase (NADPH)
MAVKEYGVQLAIQMCNTLKNNGIRGFHFYTLNLERSIRLILEGMEFVAHIEHVKPLPWSPSKSPKREKENVRPIFWRNRVASYLARTQEWVIELDLYF